MIKYRCPNCQQKLGVPDEYEGRRIRCSKCAQPSVVPRRILPVAQPVQNTAGAVPVAAVAAQAASARPQPAPAAAGVSRPAPIPHQHRPAAADPTPPSQSVTTMPDLPELVPEEERMQEVQEDPNAQILRDFRNSRARKIDLKIPGRKPGRREKPPKPDQGEEKGGFSLGDLIPDALRTPLAILLALGLVGGLILTWVAVAKTADSSMSFFVALIPLAGGAALRLIPERGMAVGLMAVILGIAGVGAGKAAMAKWGMIPMLEKRAHEEVLENLPALLNDKNLQMPPDQSAKFIIKRWDCLMCVALIQLVDQKEADPREARALALEMFSLSGTGVSFTEAITNIGANDAAAESRREIFNERMEDNQLYNKATGMVFSWEDSEALQLARRYYPAFSRLVAQAQLLYNLENSEDLFKFAFIASLSALDMIWIALGVGGAFVITGLD